MSSDHSQPGGAWNAFWRGTADEASLASGGVTHPLLNQFWLSVFTPLQNRAQIRMIDIASGNGAVLVSAAATLNADALDVTCLDNAPDALEALVERFPRATPCLADAADIPLPDASFDLVTSQFGAEYAGHRAIDEAARLVRPGGTLALVVHHRGGGIWRECAASADAITRMTDSGYIEHSIRLIETRAAVLAGGSDASWEQAKRSMMPSVIVMKQILQDYGPHVAGDTIQRLYDDVSGIHRRLERYSKDEVLGWLGQMGGEMSAYVDRMNAMCDAALDSTAWRDAMDRLIALGFRVETDEALHPSPGTLPLAWRLVAIRQ